MAPQVSSPRQPGSKPSAKGTTNHGPSWIQKTSIIFSRNQKRPKRGTCVANAKANVPPNKKATTHEAAATQQSTKQISSGDFPNPTLSMSPLIREKIFLLRSTNHGTQSTRIIQESSRTPPAEAIPTRWWSTILTEIPLGSNQWRTKHRGVLSKHDATP